MGVNPQTNITKEGCSEKVFVGDATAQMVVDLKYPVSLKLEHDPELVQLFYIELKYIRDLVLGTEWLDTYVLQVCVGQVTSNIRG